MSIPIRRHYPTAFASESGLTFGSTGTSLNFDHPRGKRDGQQRGPRNGRKDEVSSNKADALISSSGDSYERALIELQHDYLPRLAEAGVIRHDRSRATVRYHPHEGLEDLLWVVSERLE